MEGKISVTNEGPLISSGMLLFLENFEFHMAQKTTLDPSESEKANQRFFFSPQITNAHTHVFFSPSELREDP